jgi:energy-coupling factor transport system substrate-specific component
MAGRLGTWGHQEVWRFSNKEIVQVATGAFFYAVFFWILKTWPVSFPAGNLTLSVSPAIAIPIFMGLLFGPIVGGLTGLIGQTLGGIVSASGFSWPWVVGVGLVGLIAGLAVYVVRDYKTVNDYLKGGLFILLGSWVGAAFGALVGEVLILKQGDMAAGTTKLLSQGLTYTLNGIVLVPILIYLWNVYHRKNS